MNGIVVVVLAAGVCATTWYVLRGVPPEHRAPVLLALAPVLAVIAAIATVLV